MSKKIIVEGTFINLSDVNGEKYISLTDMARQFGEPNILIGNWMKKKDTIKFGQWVSPEFSLYVVKEFKRF